MPSALAPPTDTEIHVWRVELGGAGRTAARAALSNLLAKYLGAAEPSAAGKAAEPPALAVDPGGKPRLAEDPGRLSFNLSHSGDLALIAVGAGGTEVGVDVERLKARRDLVRLAARWLPEDDAAVVASAASEEEREVAFYAAWTRHEARVKCTGVGLAGPVPGPEVCAYALEVGAGYAAAVALEPAATNIAEPRITVRSWGR
jgi:4'-phosphopantetheinyl transferase